MKFTKEEIKQIEDHISADNISKVKHPVHDIYILTYTKQCQYGNAWDDITMVCRGLVVDAEYNIISHSMKKFFNHFELERMNIEPPVLPFEVFEKMDGSLIYLFNYNGEWIFISKGSFQSEQCIEAKKIFEEIYSYNWLVKHITYSFEVIYQENRIVIDYGDRRDLVALTMFDNESGNEIPFYSEPFNIVKKYDGLTQISEIKDQFNHLRGVEFEGVVLRFNDGFRMKIKMDDYFRLHRLLSGLSEKSLWELLSTKADVDEFKSLFVAEEEILHWINTTIATFQYKFMTIEDESKRVFSILKERTNTQKEFAIEALQCENSSILFSMYHGKSYDGIIWGLLKPKGVNSFRNIEDLP